MVKLPGWEELGQAPRVDGGRAVGSYDANQMARAGANFGKAVGEVATGIAEYRLEENRFEYHQAHSEHLTNKIETYGALQADTDYATMGDRYGKGIDKINSDAAARISDPVMRERFLTDTKSDVAQYKNNVAQHAQKLYHGALDGNDLQQGVRFQDLMSKAPDEGTRAQLLQQRNNDIDALVGKGVLTPEQAFGRKKQFAVGWAVTDAEMRGKKDPQGVLNTLDAKPGSDAQLIERIVQVESGGDPHSRAATTSAYGAAQFLASREGGDTTWRDLLAKNHPELVAGKSLDEINALRADPGLAREMLGKIVEQNRGILTRNGLEATPGALYLSHFLGPKSAVALLQASPGQPIADVLSKAVGPDMARQMVAANPEVLGGKLAGTVKDWADRKMGGATPGAGTIYDFLPAEVRERLKAHLQQELQKQTVNDLTGFKQRWQDTVAEAQHNPDGPSKPMGLEEFAHALGAAAAPAAYERYQTQLRLESTIHQLADMSPSEQQRFLGGRSHENLTPVPGQEGYAEAVKRQKEVKDAIDKIAEDRKHPADFAISRLPAAREAWGNLAQKLNDPTSNPDATKAAAREFADKTLLEQERVGIPADKRRIVPDDYTKQIAAKLDNPKAAGGASNVANIIRHEAELWGENWPLVYRDIAKQGSPAALVIGSGVTDAAAQILAEHAHVNTKDILNDQSEVKITTLRTEVQSAFRPFAHTLRGQEGAQPVIDAFQGQGEKLAAFYVRNGEETGAAATKAFQQLLGQKYEFVGSGGVFTTDWTQGDRYRIPKDIGPASDVVKRGAEFAKTNLERYGLAPMVAAPGVGPDYAMAETLKGYKRNATWTTAPGDAGLMLVSGQQAVRKKQTAEEIRLGEKPQPFVLTWDELALLGRNDPASPPRPPTAAEIRLRELDQRIEAGRKMADKMKAPPWTPPEASATP